MIVRRKIDRSIYWIAFCEETQQKRSCKYMRTSQLSGANSLIFRTYPPYTRTWYPIWAGELQQRLGLCSIAIIIILARYMHCIVSIMPVFLLTLMPSMVVVGTGVHECTGWSSPRKELANRYSETPFSNISWLRIHNSCANTSSSGCFLFWIRPVPASSSCAACSTPVCIE